MVRKVEDRLNLVQLSNTIYTIYSLILERSVGIESNGALLSKVHPRFQVVSGKTHVNCTNIPKHL
jgi:hypothetical protein